jgi:hypothetical protein
MQAQTQHAPSWLFFRLTLTWLWMPSSRAPSPRPSDQPILASSRWPTPSLSATSAHRAATLVSARTHTVASLRMAGPPILEAHWVLRGSATSRCLTRGPASAMRAGCTGHAIFGYGCVPCTAAGEGTGTGWARPLTRCVCTATTKDDRTTRPRSARGAPVAAAVAAAAAAAAAASPSLPRPPSKATSPVPPVAAPPPAPAPVPAAAPAASDEERTRCVCGQTGPCSGADAVAGGRLRWPRRWVVVCAAGCAKQRKAAV